MTWWKMKVKVAQSFMTLCDPMDNSPWNSLGHSIGVGSLSNPGIKPRSPALQADSLPAEPQEKPKNIGVGSLSFSSRSSRARNQTGVSCIVGRFFTNWAIKEVWGNQHHDVKTLCTVFYVVCFAEKPKTFCIHASFIVGFASFECMCSLDFILPELLHRLWSLPLCPQFIDGNVAQ